MGCPTGCGPNDDPRPGRRAAPDKTAIDKTAIDKTGADKTGADKTETDKTGAATSGLTKTPGPQWGRNPERTPS